MFWIPWIICISCLLFLKQVLTRQIARHTPDTSDTPEPVIGTPVHTAQIVTPPSYQTSNDKSHIAIAKQMVKSLLSAGYTHKPGEQGSVMLVRQTSVSEIQEIAAEIAASESDGEGLKWVLVHDKRRSVIHLGVAVNVVWCAREGGPDVEPEVVLTSLRS